MHDELVFEVVEADAPALRAAVTSAMVDCVQQLLVPLRVVIKQGPNLGAMVSVQEAMTQTQQG